MKDSTKLSGTFRVLVFAVLCLALALPAAGADHQGAKNAAIKAAGNFLQMIDGGRYAASWDETAPIFRAQVSREQWTAKLAELRPLFGALNVRKIKAAKFATTLPGAPDGEYVVIRFASSFAKKEAAIETVTMMRVGVRWMVAGYYIR